MSKIIKDTLIIMAITLVAGLALAVVKQVTEQPIKDANAKKTLEAYQEVFPDADSFEDFEAFDADAAADVIAEASSGEVKTSGIGDSVIDACVEAYDANGEVVGYVMTVTNNEAYDGSLQLTVGIQNDGTVLGISFLDLSETPGLGMNANKPEFKDQFSGVQTDAFEYTKDTATGDQIQAMSGATITTNATTHAVNAAIAYFKSIEGGN